MKKLILFTLVWTLTVLPTLSAWNVREIVRYQDILEDTYDEDGTEFWQYETVRFSIDLLRDDVTVPITSTDYPVWRAWLAADINTLYIQATGTVVSADDGQVRIELDMDESALTNQTYVSQVNLYNAAGANMGVIYSTSNLVVNASINTAGAVYAGPVTNLLAANIDFGTGTDNYVWTSDGAGGEAWEASAGAAEVNDLEGTAPTSIQTTEIFVGTGAGTGTNAALSGDATMDNAGAVTVAATHSGSAHSSYLPLAGGTMAGTINLNSSDISNGGTIGGVTVQASTLTEGGDAVYSSGEVPGGELGGTFASFTVDSTHAGSAHHDAVTLGATVTDIFDLTTQAISADDPAGDRVLFWDDSESKLEHLQIGANLSISGTTLAGTGNATAVGAYGSVYISTALVNSPDGVTKEKLGGDSGATSANEVSGFTHTSPGRLTYTGTDTRTFHVSAVLSVIHDSNSTICEYYIATNGTVIANSQINRKIGTGADVGALGLEWTVELATSDYIEIWSDDDKTGDATVQYGVISIQETQVSGIVNDDIDTFAELDAIVADNDLGTVKTRTYLVTPRNAVRFIESTAPELTVVNGADILSSDDVTYEWVTLYVQDAAYESGANFQWDGWNTLAGATTGAVSMIVRKRSPPGNGAWSTIETNTIQVTSVDETAPVAFSVTSTLDTPTDGNLLEVQWAFTNAVTDGPDHQCHSVLVTVPTD